jgi:hypothetical protein
VFADTLTGFAPTGSDTFCKADVRDTISYYWRVRAKDAAGNWSGWSLVHEFSHKLGGVKDAQSPLIRSLAVECRPNPFARSVELRLSVPRGA